MYSLESSNGQIWPKKTMAPYPRESAQEDDRIKLVQPSVEATDQCVESGILGNKILTQIPAEDIARLSPNLEPVLLSRCQDIRNVESGDCFVYFPQNVVISQLSVFKDGGTAEVAMIGMEGVVGLNFLFNSHAPTRWSCVTIAGKALRMRAKYLKREFDRAGAQQQLLLDYTGIYFDQVSQRAVCNSQHKIEERFASWLLMMRDRAGDNRLLLTQEQIASRLCTRRSSITLAAMALQERQLISYLRGRIHILNHEALETAACECYRMIN